MVGTKSWGLSIGKFSSSNYFNCINILLSVFFELPIYFQTHLKVRGFCNFRLAWIIIAAAMLSLFLPFIKSISFINILKQMLLDSCCMPVRLPGILEIIQSINEITMSYFYYYCCLRPRMGIAMGYSNSRSEDLNELSDVFFPSSYIESSKIIEFKSFLVLIVSL